jgi:hypothetical protein
VIQISMKVLRRFISSADKLINKKDKVYLSSYNGTLSIFMEDESNFIVIRIPCDERFNGALIGDRFVNVLKKIRSEDITLSFKKNKVVLKSEDFSSDFSVSKSFKTPEEIPSTSFTGNGSHCDIRVGCHNVSNSMKNNFKGKGILLDNKWLCAFDHTMMKICYHGFNVENRVVFSKTFSDTVKSIPEEEISEFCLFGNSSFGVKLTNDIIIVTKVLDDSYPIGYLEIFEVGDIDDPYKDNYFFEFDRDSLYKGIDLLSASIGDEDPFISVDMLKDKWLFKVSSFTKSESRFEISVLNPTNDIEPESIRIHKANFVTLLKQYKDNILISNKNSKFLVISNREKKDLTILMKTSI